jgi:hypothetical protein
VAVRATLIEGNSNRTTYKLTKKSNSFRNTMLEIDVCASVNQDPVIPLYDTHSNTHRPSTLLQRNINIERAYYEAGIDVTVNPERSIIDDASPQYTTWSERELHDAMETHFSKINVEWPNFHLWSVLAGEFENSSVAGVMFDLTFPHRQGCAIFKNHSWFKDIVSNPTTPIETRSMRQLLYTYVHEIGHAFNFVHSWDKGRPDSLSWMNYPQEYDFRNGGGSFWWNFFFRFDDNELIHLRHGELKSVSMGGDSWSSGRHLSAPLIESEITNKSNLPLQATLRSKRYFRYLEHVVVELKIKNVSSTVYEINEKHSTENGNVTVYIERPDKSMLEYSPIFSMIVLPKRLKLESDQSSCQNIALSYGKHGNYFDQPGIYKIRALYHDSSNIPIPTNILEIKIGIPASSKEDRDGVEFYSRDTGTALYLNGSDSHFLEDGMRVLNRMSKDYAESSVGAQISLLLAKNLCRPFYGLRDSKRVEIRKADTNGALELLRTTLKQHEQDEETLTNLTYHDCRRTEASVLLDGGKKDEAKEVLKDLTSYLDSRKVKHYVLDEIDAFMKTL